MTPARRRLARRRPGAALLATGLLAVGLTGTAAGATPTPEPSPTPDPVPEAVTAWFAQDGLAAAEQAGLGTDDDPLAVGRPREVALWSSDYIAGDPAAEPTQRVGEWLAPVTAPPPEEGERVAVGVVRAGGESDTDLQLREVLADPDLAAALDHHDGVLAVVHDPELEGWFALADGEVWPLEENARTVLQGSLALDVFQGFVHQRLGEPTATPVPLPEVAEDEGVSPLVPIIVIVLVGSAAAWLLLRQYRRDDSRIAADVRAGVSPPRHDDTGR